MACMLPASSSSGSLLNLPLRDRCQATVQTQPMASANFDELRIWPVRTGTVPKQLVASSAAVEFAGAAVGDVQGLTESRIVPRMLREGYLSIYVVGALVSGWLTCEVGNDGQMADMKGGCRRRRQGRHRRRSRWLLPSRYRSQGPATAVSPVLTS
jgi:hypothetical protein